MPQPRKTADKTNGQPEPDALVQAREILIAQIQADEESIAPIEAQIADVKLRIRRAKAMLAAMDDPELVERQDDEPKRTRSTGSGQRVNKSERQAQLLKLLSDRGPMSAAELAEHFGFKQPVQAYNITKPMIEDGRIRKDGTKFALPA